MRSYAVPEKFCYVVPSGDWVHGIGVGADHGEVSLQLHENYHRHVVVEHILLDALGRAQLYRGWNCLLTAAVFNRPSHWAGRKPI